MEAAEGLCGQISEGDELPKIKGIGLTTFARSLPKRRYLALLLPGGAAASGENKEFHKLHHYVTIKTEINDCYMFYVPSCVLCGYHKVAHTAPRIH